MNNILTILVTLLFLSSSCAVNDSIQRTKAIGNNVVSFNDNQGHKTSPRINDSLEVSIGPTVPGQTLGTSSTKEKSQVWGLSLSPGLNRVICHAVAVKALYEQGIRFNIITGSGMGAIIAAYLAKGITPEVIEWRFHNFFQKASSLKPFSKEWLLQVEKVLLTEFKGMKIQSTKVTLLIPLYNNKEKSITYLKRGNLYDKLLEGLTLFKRSKGDYSTPLDKSIKNYPRLKELGVQKLVGINVLNEKITFEKNEDFLVGIYGKLSSQYSGYDNYDYEFKLPVKTYFLDTTIGLPKHLRNSYLFVRNNSREIQKEYLREKRN